MCFCNVLQHMIHSDFRSIAFSVIPPSAKKKWLHHTSKVLYHGEKLCKSTYFPAAWSLVLAIPLVSLQHNGSAQSALLPSL